MKRVKQHKGRRLAFTLVELIVVIVIIVLLIAMVSWAAFALIGNQQRRNTESTIRVVNKVLQDHWKFVVEEAKKDTISLAVRTLAEPDPTGERARVIWIKCRLAEAFPQSYAEITDPQVYKNQYIPLDQQRYHAQYVAALGGKTSANKPITESAACLRIALSIARGGNALNDEQIRHALADTDGDGIKEILDGWNRPLAFFRFPWNNSALQLTNPGIPDPRNTTDKSRSATYADPLDTGGTLINPSWYWNKNGNRSTFESDVTFHAVTKPSSPPVPNQLPTPAQGQPLIGCYVIPVIVSAGADGLFGMTPGVASKADSALSPEMSASTSNPKNYVDNLFSFLIK